MNPGSPSPCAEGSLLRLLWRKSLPFLGAACGMTVLGCLAGESTSVAGRRYIWILTWGILLGFQIMREERIWNLSLLLGFAFLSGVLLSALSAVFFRPLPWAASGGLLILGSGLSLWAGNPGPRLRRWLSLTYVIYLGGWLYFVFFARNSLCMYYWAAAGLPLFPVLLILILKEPCDQAEEQVIPLAGDVFVLVLNLFWITALMQRRLDQGG